MTRLTNLERMYGKNQAHTGQQLSLFGAQPEPGGGQPKGSTAPAVEERQVSIIDTLEKLAELVRRLEVASVISFDTETTSTDQMRAELVGISLALETGHGYYIPVGHRTASAQVDLATVINALRAPLTAAHIAKVGHNLKYDYVVLARYGLRASPLSFDTMIAEWLINPASRNLGLKHLSWTRQGIKMTNIDELIGKGKKQITMADVPVEQAAAYAAADAEVVLRLMPELEKELHACQADKLMHEIELPLISVLADMEMIGVGLDLDFLKKMSVELEQRLKEIEIQVMEAAGYPFNLNSPQQLSQALFERLRIPPPDRSQRTATGFYSTSAEVLETLRGKHPVVDLVLEYRELSKLKSTYVDALPLQINPITGRVHTSYQQTGSITGRIASTEPNLQNIPIRTELGRQVRKAFLPRRATCCSQPITRKSNCALLPIWRMTRRC